MLPRRLLLTRAIGAGTLLISPVILAEPSEWYNAGSELTNEAGVWSMSSRLEPVKLLESGLTHLRVTSGLCNVSPESHAAYDVSLAAPRPAKTPGSPHSRR